MKIGVLSLLLFLMLSDADGFTGVSRPTSISTSTAAVSYKSADLPLGKASGIQTLLTRSDASDGKDFIIDVLKMWETDASKINQKKLTKWMKEGLVISLSESGSESGIVSGEAGRTFGLPKKRYTSADLFVNIGDSSEGLTLLRANKAHLKNRLASDREALHELERSGDVFTNITAFFEDRRIVAKGDDIANRLKDFPIVSPAWKMWTNKTTTVNATSLTQVFAEYYRDYSVGDNGGINVQESDYVPKAGYPGTLAPGEKFIQDCAIEDLPKRILHPWPAMQEIQFHVRQPPSHPMIPPPLLWMALNDMFTENFTSWQLGLPSEEVVGGWMMEPKDAIRISKQAKFGLSYRPEEQIPHGGMIFKGGIGGSIPFYQPDHGPTVSKEEAAPPVPEDLRHITERWIDPYKGIDLEVPISTLTAQEEDEIRAEEAIRRQAAEKILSFFGTKNIGVGENTYASSTVENVKANKRLKDSTAVYYDNLRTATMEDFERAAVNEDENAEMEAKNTQDTNERDVRVKKTLETLEEVAAGQTRGRRGIISYVIETIRDMQSEIARAEQDVATKRRAGRRRQRKGGSSSDSLPDASIGSSDFDTSMGTIGGRGGGDSYGESGGGEKSSIF